MNLDSQMGYGVGLNDSGAKIRRFRAKFLCRRDSPVSSCYGYCELGFCPPDSW